MLSSQLITNAPQLRFYRKAISSRQSELVGYVPHGIGQGGWPRLPDAMGAGIREQRFECLVDRVGYRGRPKPKGTEMGAIRNRLARPEAHVSIGVEHLQWALEHGLTIMPGVCVGGTRAGDWVRQQLWFLDFDNDAEAERRGYPPLDPLDAMARAYDEPNGRAHDLEPLFLYFSASATVEPWNPRYRLVFAAPEPVSDRRDAERVGAELLRIFPEADQSSCQLNRMFLSPGKEVLPLWISQI